MVRMQEREGKMKEEKAAGKKLHIHVMLDRKAMKGNFYVLEAKQKKVKSKEY